MALQILNPQRSFGEELGTSLSSGLNRLLENKLQQIHFSDSLKQNNYSDAQIALLNQLPVNQRLEALQSINPSGRGQQLQQTLPRAQIQPEAQQLSERAQGLGKQPEPLSQQELMGEFQQNQLQQMGLGTKGGPSQDVQTLLGEATRQGLNLTDQQKQKIGRKVQEIYADQGKRKALEQDVMSFLNQQQAIQQPQENQPAQEKSLPIEVPFKKSLTEAHKLAEKKFELTEKKEQRAEQTRIDKETKPFYEEITNAAKASYASDNRLNRMEELVNKGKLPLAGPRAFVNSILRPFFGKDFDLSQLGNPDAAEFVKLQNDFLRDAKNIFGSRLTNYDVETFLKVIPGLSMSDEGKRRIIYELKLMNEAARIKKQTADQLIKSNKGRRPENLDILVEEEAKPQLDQISNKFKKGLPGNVSFLGI